MKALFLACALLLHSAGAWACSCVSENLPEKQKVAKAHAQASLVFTGRITAEELVEKTDTLHFRSRSGSDTVVTSRQQYRSYTFTIMQQLKGKLTMTSVTVLTAGPGSSCGVSYKVGADFLVFAYAVDTANTLRGGAQKTPPYFTTGLCTRTRELRYTTAAELRQLQRLARHG